MQYWVCTETVAMTDAGYCVSTETVVWISKTNRG